MKKTLSYLALCFVAATVAGCQTEDADPFGGTASVRIEKTGHQNPSEFEVRFTPSDNSVSYRYAIGDESDFEAFRAGTLPGSMTVADGTRRPYFSKRSSRRRPIRFSRWLPTLSATKEASHR